MIFFLPGKCIFWTDKKCISSMSREIDTHVCRKEFKPRTPKHRWIKKLSLFCLDPTTTIAVFPPRISPRLSLKTNLSGKNTFFFLSLLSPLVVSNWHNFRTPKILTHKVLSYLRNKTIWFLFLPLGAACCCLFSPFKKASPPKKERGTLCAHRSVLSRLKGFYVRALCVHTWARRIFWSLLKF